MMKWKIPSASGVTSHRSLKILFIAALFLTIAMSFISKFNRHPDEVNHFWAADYYTSHFLPPVIDDPLIRESYSAYGVSYLNYHWAEYFYAGKVMALLSPFVSEPYIAARLSSVLLFAFLIAFFLYRSRRDNEVLIIPAFLLSTSQVWYIFNYINNDAFALFISIFTAYQLVYEESLFNKFLQSKTLFANAGGGLLFGFLTGLLLACKANYYPFLIFVALWLFYKLFILKVLFNKETPRVGGSLHLIKKLAFAVLIAASILSFRCAMDLYVNGETNFVGVSYISKYFGKLEKKGKLLEFQEEIAEYSCKPSTLENDLANSHRDLLLKTKGISLRELFFKWRWHEISFNSFVGGYGYMDTFGHRRFYQLVMLVYFLFTAYLSFSIIRSKNAESIGLLAITLFTAVLTVAISVALSWIYAFQPQGRYLFPVIGMFGALTYANRRLLHSFIVNAFFVITFLLSAYAFVFVALLRINDR